MKGVSIGLMSWHSSFTTDEPEVAAEALSEAYGDIGLSLADDEAVFSLAFERLDAGPFKLDRAEIDATVAFGFETKDEFFVSRVNRGRLRVAQADADERLGRGELALIARPGVDSTTEIADFAQSVITLHAPAVREAADLDPDSGGLPVFTSVRPVDPARAQIWNRAVDFVSGMLEDDPGVVDSPLVIGSTNRMLAGLLLATFPNTANEPAHSRDDHDAHSAGTIHRAVSFIDSNADLDIGIGDIATAVGVSRRAVQLAFRRHLDSTPTAYLRQVRLDAAHRELVAATPGSGLTVTEVAYHWGFSSPSRFAERYRATFGHSPSETLRG
jgi:AraC-like DNA-binding protein